MLKCSTILLVLELYEGGGGGIRVEIQRMDFVTQLFVAYECNEYIL